MKNLILVVILLLSMVSVSLAEDIPCVCAECNKKCGSGHETWCSSYQKPKANNDLYVQTVNPNDLKKSDPKTLSLKINPPPPLPDPPKEPSVTDKLKGTIQQKIEPLQPITPSAPGGGAVRG